jgi:hypothetical protein
MQIPISEEAYVLYNQENGFLVLNYMGQKVVPSFKTIAQAKKFSSALNEEKGFIVDLIKIPTFYIFIFTGAFLFTTKKKAFLITGYNKTHWKTTLITLAEWLEDPTHKTNDKYLFTKN